MLQLNSLSSCSREELEQALRKIPKLLEKRDKENESRALVAVENLARENGMSLSELLTTAKSAPASAEKTKKQQGKKKLKIENPNPPIDTLVI